MAVNTSNKATEEIEAVVGVGEKAVTFPSSQFPGPPAVGLVIPESWVAIEPGDYVHLSQKVDLAVCSPTSVDGVTPAVAVSVVRTLPTENPEALLTEILTGQLKSLVSAAVVTSRFQASPRPSISALIRDQFPGKVMEHLFVLSYVHDARLAHIINVSGVYAAGSTEGQQTIFGIIGLEGIEI